MKLQATTFIYKSDDGKRYDVYFTKVDKGYAASIVYEGKIVFNHATRLANHDSALIILKKYTN
jgi:hypothetical protein